MKRKIFSILKSIGSILLFIAIFYVVGDIIKSENEKLKTEIKNETITICDTKFEPYEYYEKSQTDLKYFASDIEENCKIYYLEEINKCFDKNDDVKKCINTIFE